MCDFLMLTFTSVFDISIFLRDTTTAHFAQKSYTSNDNFHRAFSIFIAYTVYDILHQKLMWSNDKCQTFET